MARHGRLERFDQGIPGDGPMMGQYSSTKLGRPTDRLHV